MYERSQYSDLTDTERDRIERFVTAYNAIKEQLARLTDKPEKASLNELITTFGREHRRWRIHDGAELLELSEMRNLLVHERNEPYEYLVAPTQLALERIERILERLERPLRILAGMPQRAVTTVTPADSIIQALKLIAQYNYSQFPVYDGAAYCGILTTNGIARWLSDNFKPDETLSCVVDCTVAQVLEREEPVEIAFISAEQTVEDVVERFAEDTTLVCLLVTANGAQGGALQQIVTRFDVAALLARLMEPNRER